jgi:hypothetical protein
MACFLINYLFLDKKFKWNYRKTSEFKARRFNEFWERKSAVRKQNPRNGDW